LACEIPWQNPFEQLAHLKVKERKVMQVLFRSRYLGKAKEGEQRG
jgi:hypothetical protein